MAFAADCPVSDYPVQASTREAALLEGGGLAASQRWPDARAAYLWVLARDEEDPEALAALARVDAWGGCWALAESEYQKVLAAHPEDADVRAGYVDLLTWRGQLDDARAALAQGLASDPSAPALLARAAKFAWWQGEAASAVRLGDAAERGAPDDDEVRSARDHFFVNEGRVGARLDRYPASYPSITTLSAQVLERVGRFELMQAAQLVDRAGAGVHLLDVRLPVDVSYHPAMGWTVGAEVAPGIPGHAVPDWALRGFGIAPLAGPFDASLSYDYWHFSNPAHTEVHLLNPAVGVSLPSEIRLDLRAWMAVVGAQGTRAKVAGAAGLQATWSATSRMDLALAVTYGQELEPTTIATQLQLLAYTGPSATAFADLLVHRHFGFRPALGLQVLQANASPIWIESVEVGAYARF